MFLKLFLFATLVALINARPKKPLDENGGTAPRVYEPSEHELEQNRNAKYQFSSDVVDQINDLTQKRDETRDGLNVKGSYSYSDGFYKRTVYYEADDKGYRVTKTDVEELDKPKIDLTGTASVKNNAHGRHISYKVQSVPVEGPVGKIVSEVD